MRHLDINVGIVEPFLVSVNIPMKKHRARVQRCRKGILDIVSILRVARKADATSRQQQRETENAIEEQS